MDMVHRSGQMEQNMRANGKIIKHTVKVHFGMFMVINTKDNGKEIKPMASENTPTVTELHTKVTGATTYNTVTG